MKLLQIDRFNNHDEWKRMTKRKTYEISAIIRKALVRFLRMVRLLRMTLVRLLRMALVRILLRIGYIVHIVHIAHSFRIGRLVQLDQQDQSVYCQNLGTLMAKIVDKNDQARWLQTRAI